MSLRLHEASHDTETGKQLPSVSPCGHTWDDSVIRSLHWCQYIRTIGIK